jgi:hypothetical protein
MYIIKCTVCYVQILDVASHCYYACASCTVFHAISVYFLCRWRPDHCILEQSELFLVAETYYRHMFSVHTAMTFLDSGLVLHLTLFLLCFTCRMLVSRLTPFYFFRINPILIAPPPHFCVDITGLCPGKTLPICLAPKEGAILSGLDRTETSFCPSCKPQCVHPLLIVYINCTSAQYEWHQKPAPEYSL